MNVIEMTTRPLILLLPALLTAQAPPFQTLSRISDQPILWPQGSGFESAGVFNPAVTRAGGRYVMLYRAQDQQGISRLGFASSKDGVHFTRQAQPVLSPETDYERGGGVEDPRIVKIGNTYYLTYTGYNGKDAQLCLAVSRDLEHWERKGVILPAYKGRWNTGWTKSAQFSTGRSGAGTGCTSWAMQRIVRDRWGSPIRPIWVAGPRRWIIPCSRRGRGCLTLRLWSRVRRPC